MTRLQFYFAAFLAGLVVLLTAVWMVVLPLLGLWWIAGKIL